MKINKKISFYTKNFLNKNLQFTIFKNNYFNFSDSSPNNSDSSTEVTDLKKIYNESNVGKNVDYLESQTKHRVLYSIYDLAPVFDHCFIASNATIVGEVKIGSFCSIGFNVVIRGDINSVNIGKITSIGEHTVINTVNSLPTGLPSVVEIGENCTIQNKCSLVSCFLEDDVFVGHNSVILEGARIERGAIILPNSVVPPGRIIPAHQIWGGNPVRYIRDVKGGEVYSNYASTIEIWKVGEEHLQSYMPFNYAYLDQEAYKEDLDLTPDMMENVLSSPNRNVKYQIDGNTKYYLV